MIRYLFCLFVCLASFKANATWSIIVIDPVTREIGVAGASCSQSVYGIQAIIPGKGAVIVQAASNNNARRKGYQLVIANASPEEIMAAMKDPAFDPENQQYAVITVNRIDHPLVYTGSNAHDAKGSVTGHGISVQGNTLVTEQELAVVYETAVTMQKQGSPLHDVLMLALEAGAKLGGDKRCGARTASSSFLTIFKPGDDINTPSVNLVVYGTDDHTINAIEALRKKFDAWKIGKKE